MLVRPTDAIDKFFCPVSPKQTTCKANACMAWRWVAAPTGTEGAPQNIQDPHLNGKEGVGFCGLAGNPCTVKDS